jgi:cytochrome c-type biogenesis protein CcmF
MIGPLGHLCILLGFVMAVAGAGLSFLAGYSRNPSLARWAERAAFTVFALVASAVALMLTALVTHDFAVKYIADIGSRTTPLYYTIISLWAALEGSILFWALLLSGYTTVFLLLYRDRFAGLRPYVTGVLLAISSFFLFVIAGPGNPFVRITPAAPAPGCPADGCGPNPLLQNHPMMGLHPPLLYLGYVGLSVPYAIAMAALLAGSLDADVLRLIRRWALIPWVFLSLGIVAGMWWSYAVLGWGGYWSWDPVENASVMPWLVTTAFLHSLQVQERRRMLKTWTIALIISAFILSILGTFLTRSGVIESVHSFTQSPVGPLFLIFFGVVLIISLAVLFLRTAQLGVPGTLQAIVCRETVFLLNNLVLMGITFTILLGTLFPLIAEALQGTRLSVGAPYFNHVAVPMGVALLFLMGIGPALPWGATRLDELQRRLLVPVSVATGLVVLLVLLGVRGRGPLLTFGLLGFVLAITVERIRDDVGTRRRNAGGGWIQAGGALAAANPRRYGGYLAHIGVILVVIGIAASQSYQVRASATLRPGQHLRVDGYTITYRGLQPKPEPNRMVLQAPVSVTRDGRSLGVLMPSQNLYQGTEQPIVTPAVREEPWDIVSGLLQGRNPLPDLAPVTQGRNPFEDLYVVLVSVNNVTAAGFRAGQGGSVTLQVLVNPLVGCIWLGGAVVGLGGLFALFPGRRRRRSVVTVPVIRRQAEEVPA